MPPLVQRLKVQLPVAGSVLATCQALWRRGHRVRGLVLHRCQEIHMPRQELRRGRGRARVLRWQGRGRGLLRTRRWVS